MSLWKRGDWYWSDFTVNGERFRVPLGTKDRRAACQLEKERIAEAREGKITAKAPALARSKLSEAIAPYLSTRQGFIVESSIRSERDRLNQVSARLGDLPLRRITPENIEAYIVHRRQVGVSNRTINMEIGALRRLLKKARLWHRFSDDIKPLPQKSEVGRAMSREEKTRLLKVAASRPEWRIVRVAMILALNTTMRGCEIRGLRWRDVNFLDRELTVRRSKTETGQRAIPLNADAMACILELRETTKALFGDNISLDWYVFPHCEGLTDFDPTQPMCGWRSAWRSLRAAAANGDPEKGIPPMPSLARLRFHDLRHHAITELAESETSELTIMALAGHVSKKMLEHYSHIRREAKRRAVEVLSSQRKPQSPAVAGGVTSQNHVTNGLSQLSHT